MAGKKIVWVENGLNIGIRDSSLGLIIKVMDILLSDSKNLEIIQFKDHFPPILFSFLPLLSFGTREYVAFPHKQGAYVKRSIIYDIHKISCLYFSGYLCFLRSRIKTANL